VSTEKLLKQRGVSIAVAGQYTLPNWYDSKGKLRTFACRTNRISPYEMMVDVPVVGRVGDYLTSYFRDFGPLDGRIRDTMRGSFLLELDMGEAMRERLANKLNWLEEKSKDPNIPELRKGGTRVIPAQSQSSVTLADGANHECIIVDMSVSGAAVWAQLQPPIGMPLAIGACIGRVVRHFSSGFAVQFVEKQNQNSLDRLIVRPIPSFAAAGARV
jgi:hypothetical protein